MADEFVIGSDERAGEIHFIFDDGCEVVIPEGFHLAIDGWIELTCPHGEVIRFPHNYSTGELF